MIVIIGGNFYEDYLNNIENGLKTFTFIPINIIFTSENYLNKLIKKSNNISELVSNKLSSSFYNQGICVNLEEITDKIYYFNNLELNEEKTLLNDLDYTGCFTFSIVKEYKDLIIPGIYGKIELENNKINQEEVINFNYFLVKNFYSDDLKKLLYPFIKLKEVPFELISKIYARIYTFESGNFYRVLNQKLMKCEGELYETFIQMMYKGIEIKSFQSKFNQDLYRGSFLSIEELNNLEKINYEINKRENDVPCGLVFSQTFLSFSKNQKRAEGFASNVLFKIENLNVSSIEDSMSSNADINEFSIFSSEEEVLFFPFSSFVVKKIEDYEIWYNNAGENEYIRIYNNYNFDNYYLIKAGSDKRDKCAFISEIDDDKIMCSTIFSKEFLIYKIDENEEQCIYKKIILMKNKIFVKEFN